MQTILVVDDVQTDRELVGKVVTLAGHHPVYAANGAEALEKAIELRPALILMDVVMPVQDGFKTTREIKRNDKTSKIPVVLITSKGTESDIYWGKRQGADGHVVKPFTSAILLDTINRFTSK